MSKKNDCWGIEVGNHAIKALRLVKQGDQLQVADYQVLPFKHVLTTPDLDVREQVQLGLDQLVSSQDFSKSTIMLSVSGNVALARFAKLPPVDPKKIKDIVKFEAAQQIPFPIDEVAWDYQIFSESDNPEVEVGIFAITQEKVNAFLADYKQVGLVPDGLTLSSLAVYNAFAYDMELDEDSPGMVLLDIGTTSTDVIIVEKGNMWLRTMKIGGNNFTQALVKAFKLSFPKAEKLKREAGTSKYARQIFTAMRPVFADLVQELQRSLGYYQNLNRNARLDKLIGVGSTFRLPGLQKFLKQQIQMDVEQPSRFAGLSISGKRESDFSDYTVNMATAYGLALQGLGLEKVTANILPASMLQQRLWKTKMPWFYASAAMVAVPVAMFWGSIISTGSALDEAQQASNRQVDPILGQARSFDSQWKDIQAKNDPRQMIENINRALDYRDLWPKIINDIHLASQAVRMGAGGAGGAGGTGQSGKTDTPGQDLYIESISSQYSFAPMSQPQVAVKKKNVTRRASTQPARPLETLNLSYDKAFGQAPPQFQVIVEGKIPARNATQLLSKHFIGWLRDHAQRDNRPYRIVLGDDALHAHREGTQDADELTNRRAGISAPASPAGRTRTTRSRRRSRGAGNEPNLLATAGRNRRGGGIRGAGDGRSQLTMTLKDLLPTRPSHLDASSGQDMTWFRIKWTVELLAPAQAREAERVKKPAMTEPAGQKQTSGRLDNTSTLETSS